VLDLCAMRYGREVGAIYRCIDLKGKITNHYPGRIVCMLGRAYGDQHSPFRSMMHEPMLMMVAKERLIVLARPGRTPCVYYSLSVGSRGTA